MFYGTNDVNLQMFVAALVGRDYWKKYPHLQEHLVPSSSLVLEVQNFEGKMIVELYLNDHKIPLAPCGEGNSCQASVLTSYLDSKIQYAKDAVEAACKQQ